MGGWAWVIYPVFWGLGNEMIFRVAWSFGRRSVRADGSHMLKNPFPRGKTP